MTTDVRTLLHDAAATPERAADIERALQSARTRRRRERGFSALAAVVVLALVVGVFAIGSGSGDETQVGIGIREAGSDIPDGWQTFTTERGLSISTPPGWKVESPSSTPIGQPVLIVDDLGAGDDEILAACTTSSDPAASRPAPGSMVRVFEFSADVTQVPGTNNDALPVIDRPESFAGALVPGSSTPCPYARSEQIAFREGGRAFLASVVSVFPDAAEEQARMRLGTQVLDTLRIEPARATPVEEPVTTTTPSSPAITQLPATTLPPFTPTTDDERAISELVQRWLGGEHTEESQRATIEDADSILDAIRQGLAQYPDRLPFYTGSLDALTFKGPDRASIRFTLYYKGQPAYTRDGDVVRVDGQWKVTRATECAFLAQGGITCPPPS